MKNIILEGSAQFVRKPFDDFIRFVNKTGHKNIELSLMTPHVYIDSEEYIDVCNIKEKLQEFDIKADVVTPAPYRYSITAGEDTEQYRRTLGYYKRCVEYSGYIGADYVIVTGSGGIFDGNHDELISNAAHTLRIICDYADSYGITVLIGTVFGKYSPYNETTPVLVELEQINSSLNLNLNSDIYSEDGLLLDKKKACENGIIDFIHEKRKIWITELEKEIEDKSLIDLIKELTSGKSQIRNYDDLKNHKFFSNYIY